MKRILQVLTLFLSFLPITWLAGQNNSYRIQDKETDTLRDQNHYYYLADLPIRTVGQLILDDSILPSDNWVTFTLMDTISTCRQADLEFYLAVFEKIMELSDGALSEAVGSYSWDFIEKRPAIFIKHLETVDRKCIDRWAYNTFYEMYFSYSGEELKITCNEMLEKLKKIETTENLLYFCKQTDKYLKKESQSE